MDFLAFSLGKIVCDASTAIVYAARCTDPLAMGPLAIDARRHACASAPVLDVPSSAAASIRYTVSALAFLPLAMA